MRWLGLLVIYLLVAAPAAATPAEFAFAGAEGIVAARADGSDRHVLVAGKTVSQPAWSPDGTTLAYVKGARIMVGAAAFTAPPEGGSDNGPTWSPDGTTIVFSRFIERSDSDFRTQVILRVVATGAEHVLVNQKLDGRFTSVSGSAWSPDGTTIAYSRSRLNRKYYFDEDVFAIPAAGGTPRLLIRDGHSAVWSPGRPADRLRGHPRPQRQPLRLGRVQLGRRALHRQRRRQRAHAPHPQRVRGRHPGVVAGRIPDPVQQRPERARGRFLRGLLDRSRRQLLHVAHQRHAVERVSHVATRKRRRLRPRQLRPEHARAAARRDVPQTLRGRSLALRPLQRPAALQRR